MTYLVRLWDKDWNLLETIYQGWRIDEPDTVTVSADSRIGQWLLKDAPQRATVMTVDDPSGGRWHGRLDRWDMRKDLGVEAYVKAKFLSDAWMRSFVEGLAALTPAYKDGTDLAGP